MKVNLFDKIIKYLLIFSSVALVSVLVIFGASKLLPNNSSISIPDFSEFTISEVEQWIIDNKLTDEQVRIDYAFDEVIEKDMLISQTIEEGAKLESDATLVLLYSQGYDPELLVEIPDFTGWTTEEIEAWFTDNKFSDVTFEYLADSDIEEGIFISSNLTDEFVARNALVLISVSVGEKSIGIDVTVPDFTDYTRANIASWAKTNNISVTFLTTTSTTIQKNSVISQVPAAGTTMQTGGSLKITLSLGKGITASNLAGQTRAQIESWRKENNLLVTYQEYYSNSVTKNTAISSSPVGTVSEGSTITVNISIGKPIISNFTGSSLSQFKSHIQNINAHANASAKITIAVTEVENTTSTAGTILSISVGDTKISGDTEVSVGSTITVQVAKEKTVSVSSKSGSTEADFKNYIEGLGLVIGTKSTRYSTTISQGLLVSNDTGTKSLGASINYVISLGAFNPIANDFNGKTESQIKVTINTANQLGAGWSTSFLYAYNNDVAKGQSYGCTITSTTVKCSISNGSYISVVNKAGTTEANFLTYISGLGLKAEKRKSVYSDSIAAGSIVWNLTGSNFTSGNIIEYDVSLGPEVKIQIPEIVQNLQLLSDENYDKTVSRVRTTFSGFTNLSFVAVDSDTNSIVPGGPDGLVVYIQYQSGANVVAGQSVTPDTAIIIGIIKK
ncbi:MAG: PASTA domain-containing protein [Anaerorhabdus sp.]